MASTDFQDPIYRNCAQLAPPGPRTDGLGRALFVFHALIGVYLLIGWLAADALLLAVYLVLLPVIAVQWLLNQGSCVLNNIESWLRHGRWRDPRNHEEGGFLMMLADWLFRWRPSRTALDLVSYATVAALWTLGFAHLSLVWA